MHFSVLSPKDTSVPIERDDASATTSETGKRRSARISSISRPTLPVAPTTATLYAMINSSRRSRRLRFLEREADGHIPRGRHANGQSALRRARRLAFLLLLLSTGRRLARRPAFKLAELAVAGAALLLLAGAGAGVGARRLLRLRSLGLRLRRYRAGSVRRSGIGLKLLRRGGLRAAGDQASGDDRQEAMRSEAQLRRALVDMAQISEDVCSVLNRRRGGIKAARRSAELSATPPRPGRSPCF